jgi:hypothetical protein
MSSTVETIDPSAVLLTIRVAGTSGCRSWTGRSENRGSYPTAMSRYSRSVIAAVERPIPRGSSTRCAISSWIGVPVTSSRHAPTTFQPSFEYRCRSPGGRVGGFVRSRWNTPGPVGASSVPTSRPDVWVIR